MRAIVSNLSYPTNESAGRIGRLARTGPPGAGLRREQPGRCARPAPGLAGQERRPLLLPGDDTLGCTREACAFREDTDAFRDVGAVVLGVSVQDEASHRAFREKYRLSFDLVADPERRIAGAFRAVATHGLAKRVTYVIGPDGRILAGYRRLDPKSHSREALRILSEVRRR